MFRSAIVSVLRQVHPGMQISREALDLLERLLRHQLGTLAAYADPETAARECLGDVLMPHFLRDQARAVALSESLRG